MPVNRGLTIPEYKVLIPAIAFSSLQPYTNLNRRGIMNQDTAFRENLKNIIRMHLKNAASSIFIDKSLKTIDESADNKESFMAAAGWIGRRIATFVDKELAHSVYEALISAIEKSNVPQGTKRRYMRVPFCRKVRVKHDGKYHELDCDNISEGGMFISTNDPFPAGSTIEISLTLDGGSRIDLKGVVLYRKDNPGQPSRVPRGMAIEFKEAKEEEMGMLRTYIRKVPIQSSI